MCRWRCCGIACPHATLPPGASSPGEQLTQSTCIPASPNTRDETPSACLSSSAEMPESLKTEIGTSELSCAKFLAKTAVFEKRISSPKDSNLRAHCSESLV